MAVYGLVPLTAKTGVRVPQGAPFSDYQFKSGPTELLHPLSGRSASAQYQRPRPCQRMDATTTAADAMMTMGVHMQFALGWQRGAESGLKKTLADQSCAGA